LPKPDDLLIEARCWLGTPHRHQHAILGHGADCWTTVCEPGRTLGLLDYSAERMAPYEAYGEQPSPRVVIGILNTFLRPIEGEARTADVACLQWREGLPMHMAILGEFRGRPTLIHCLKRLGGVVEHGFTQEWPQLVHSWWRYPGLADG
jgi:hypothetical protein